jgi:hypothetical protein
MELYHLDIQKKALKTFGAREGTRTSEADDKLEYVARYPKDPGRKV